MARTYELRVRADAIDKNRYSEFVLGGDIGGTHANLAVAGIVEERPELLFSMHYESGKIDSMIPVVKEVMRLANEMYGVPVDKACFAIAGIVSDGLGRLTNIELDVCAEEIIAETSVKSARIINDFQAIGYGINFMDPADPRDILTIKTSSGSYETDSNGAEPRAIIGAGTGLGKGILIYDAHIDAYVPLPSEGGHGDFPAHDASELGLMEHIRQQRVEGRDKPASYEDVLSGPGIASIYEFLRESGRFRDSCGAEIDKSEDKARAISERRGTDEICAETVRHYARFYARCAKNFVLDTLSTGGIYVAGGIAAKNCEIFSSGEFLEEFMKTNKQKVILEKTPVYLLTNYDVSLYGACFAALL